MKKLALFMAAWILAGLVSTRALEISLEENRVRRGTVGFIDIRRVFEEFPETQKAKEQFEAEIHKRDVVLQGERRDLRELRKKLAELQAEKNFLSVTPIQVSSSAPPAPLPSPPTPLPAVSTAPAKAALPGPPLAPVSGLPGLPGLAVPAPHSISTTTAVAASTAPAAISTATAASAPVAPSTTTAVAAAPVSISTGAVSVSTAAAVPDAVKADIAARSAKYDKLIAETKDKIAFAEKGLKGDAARAEGELSKIESAESHTLLGEIYRRVQEIARASGVSIIIDKNSILYGHEAVDLTDKLLESLRTQELEGKP